MAKQTNLHTLPPERIERLKLELHNTIPYEWLDEFINRPNVKTLLAEADHIDKSRAKWLLEWVVQACHNADIYRPETDSEKVLQQNDSDVVQNEIPGQHNAIEKLRHFLEQHPDAAGKALGMAFMQWNKQHVGAARFYVECKKIRFAEMLDQLLAAYDHNLGIGEKQGNLLHRYQVGPLEYPTPLDEQNARPDAKFNGLVFELAFLFRYATAGMDAVFTEGMPMPDFGNPHIHLIEELAAVLQIKDTSAAKRITELTGKGVVLGYWP